jgi:phosphoglycolate phosphatase-like HAD superfamily hydrolase
MKLIIFDMDQTLVDFTAIHDKAAQELFKQYFGVEVRLTEIDFAGRSLAENFLELAKSKNIPEYKIRQNSKLLLNSYETSFGKNIPLKASKYVLPGVKQLLEELLSIGHLVVLYTGDSEAIVSQVLKATSLGKYFKFSVYGTKAKTRADMARLAVKRAESLSGRKFRGKDVVIIGDSIRDIECGKEINALTIAVATGFHSAEELKKLKPDYLFNNLKDYQQVLKAIG